MHRQLDHVAAWRSATRETVSATSVSLDAAPTMTATECPCLLRQVEVQLLQHLDVADQGGQRRSEVMVLTSTSDNPSRSASWLGKRSVAAFTLMRSP